ncbi:MFS transporter [Paenibacillus vulneris]|uniref:MFS transporter n=1 Tax=Paenibacillus vulneris TaxID=1133364 RepID=A0ABW3UK88_9BACL
MKLRWLIRSQSIVTLAGGMIYPYYLLLLKNLGNSYSKYGLAFAVFTISSAVVSQWIAPKLDRYAVTILAASSAGMMIVMLLFPWVSSYVWVLLLQWIMGSCNALQKTTEKVLLADYTEKGDRGGTVGTYHFWTSIASGFAVLLGGFMMDWMTMNALFYASALLYGVGAWVVWRQRREKLDNLGR